MIYLDANATSALRPEARAVLRELLDRGAVRNPSSVHAPGRAARNLISESRRSLLRLLTAGSGAEYDIIFTSGGTEACNSLVQGFGVPHTHVLSSAIEHPAMLEAVRRLAGDSSVRTLINPQQDGIVDVEQFCAALRDDTTLVALMAANNETGALQPVREIAQLLRSRGYIGAIVSDCSQLFGKALFSADEFFEVGVDAVAVSGHKFGAPAGIGAIVLNRHRAAEFHSLLVGGPQEARHRAGTENLMAIAALGEVAHSLCTALPRELERIFRLRETLWRAISSALSDVRCLTPERSLANTLLVQFGGCRGDDLVVALDLHGVACSTGSACASGKQERSHVVQAMGLGERSAREVVRFSLDWDANAGEIARAAEVIVHCVSLMRGQTTLRETVV